MSASERIEALVQKAPTRERNHHAPQCDTIERDDPRSFFTDSMFFPHFHIQIDDSDGTLDHTRFDWGWGYSDQEFTCLCGETTLYTPQEHFPVTPCSNSLCPMLHEHEIDEQKSGLFAHHFLKCRECGDVEPGFEYRFRQSSLLSDLRRDSWIPDMDDWSTEMPGSRREMEYRSEIPDTLAEGPTDVTCMETICMVCWLKEHNVDPDELRCEAQKRKNAGMQPFNYERIQQQKRERRRRWKRLSLFPLGYVSVLVLPFLESLTGRESFSIFEAIERFLGFGAVEPLTLGFLIAYTVTFILCIVGALWWMAFLLSYMSGCHRQRGI